MYEGDVLTDLDQLRSRYEVLRRLGFDGGREVYAVRSKVGERHFAVGIVDRDGAAAGPGALHLSQAHTIQPLSHPGLVPIHAVHHLQGGSVAVAIDRRRGCTLEDRLREEGTPPPSEVEAVLREIGEALGYLHGRGVVHRRVRTSSIFLDRDAERARLCVFGIEHEPVGPQGESRPVDGKRLRVGPATDLFGLGLVGYEMLAGRAPAAGDALPPLRELRPELPEPLLVAIEGCLAAKPSSRWRSAADVIAALDGEIPPRNARSMAVSIVERVRNRAASVTEEIAIAAARWPALPALAATLGATLLVTLATAPVAERSRQAGQEVSAAQAPRARTTQTPALGPTPRPQESLPIGIEWEPATEVAVSPPSTAASTDARPARQATPPASRAQAAPQPPDESTPATPPSPFADGLVLLGELVDP